MKEIKELKEIAAKYDVRAMEGGHVIVAEDENEVVVKMTRRNYRIYQDALARLPMADDDVAPSATNGEDAAEQYEREQRARLAPEVEAYKRMLPELLQTHKGQWVAIHRGRLVSAADDRAALLKYVRRADLRQAIYYVLVEEQHPPVFDMDTPEEEPELLLVPLQHE